MIGVAIATGSVVLWVAGPAVAGALGVAGGLVGAMSTRGVEKEIANYYQQAVLAGSILVAAEEKVRIANGVSVKRLRFLPKSAPSHFHCWKARSTPSKNDQLSHSISQIQSRTDIMTTNSHTKRAARDTVADRASAITKDFHEVGDAAKRIATDSVEALRETANQYLDQGRSRARELGDSVQTRVQEKPVKSLLIAAGLGFLLGALWIRR